MEKEFSFVRFFKFAMRYFLVGVLLVALGLGIGAATALTAKSTQYEKYNASITFDMEKYAKASGLGTNDSAVLSTRAAQIMEVLSSANVRSQTFAVLQNELYPAVASKTDKLQRFNADLSTQKFTNSLTISFIYDMTAATEEEEGKNRELAQRVITTYMDVAAQAVREFNDVLVNPVTFEQVFVISRIQSSYDLPAEALESNKGVSLIKNTVVGGVAGGVIAALVIFLLYFFDPRIKSVEDILPEEKAAVLLADHEDSVLRMIAHIKLTHAKRIAVTSLSADDTYEAWTSKLVENLKKSGANVKAISFAKEDPAWMSYFQSESADDVDYEVYLYNDDDMAIATYIASNADFSAFFVDQRKVMAKTLQKCVEHMPGDSYRCTVIHNTDRAYIG